MSFSSLPTELVLQIIESSVPSTFHSTTYHERQSTLRSLCLISRRFSQIAQPLLWNIIRIRSAPRLDALLESGAANGGLCIVSKIVMDPSFEQSWSSMQISRLVEIGGSLHTLCLFLRYADPIDLTVFSQLPSESPVLRASLGLIRTHRIETCTDLTKLELVNGLFTFSPHAILPKVKSLNIGFRVFDGVKSILDSKALPSLRELVLNDLDVDVDLDELPCQPFVELLSQLEMLLLDFNQRRGIPDCIIPILSRTRFRHLVDHPREFALLRQGIQHLLLEGMKCPSEGSYLGVLKSLTSELKLQDSPFLRSICFDKDVEIPTANLGELDRMHREAVVELFQVLDGKGIEVYHEEVQEFRIDEGNSDEFARVLKILEKKDAEKRE
ncbi:hypothetical protein JCM5353_001061 [Sporobolomyces roseus]